jgi:hypothetical protein
MMVAVGITTGAWGVDQLLTGKKLLVKSKNGKEKIVLISKDPSIVPPDDIPGPDPMIGIHPNEPSPPWHFEALPQGNWSETPSGIFKYKDTTAPVGSPCKVGIIKAGKLLKLVCKDTIAPLPLGGPVAVQLDTGSAGNVRYCMSFPTATEVSDTNEKYLAKNAPAPSGCPPASPSGAFLDPIATF